MAAWTAVVGFWAEDEGRAGWGDAVRGLPSAWAYREAAVRWLQTLGTSCWTRRRALNEVDRLAKEIEMAKRETDRISLRAARAAGQSGEVKP